MLSRDLEKILLEGKKAILQEGQALLHLGENLPPVFGDVCQLLMGCQGTVVLTGMGKSGLVARKWMATFVSTGTRSYFLNPAEASHGDLGLIQSKDILVLLSASGETDELRPVLSFAKENKIPCVVVTQSSTSSLARLADLLLPVDVKEEACPLGLAPTTSTTLMMALGDALAVTLMQMRGFSEKDFARLHPGGSLGRRLWLNVSQLMHSGESLPRVDIDAPLKDVLIEMTRKRMGMTVVEEIQEGSAKVVGIITDGDLRRAFQSKGMDERLKARDMATSQPKWIEDLSLATEAAHKMTINSIQQLLVKDKKGEFVGVLHLYDLLRARIV